MDDTIFLTLGGHGRNVPARAFVAALNTFLGLLRDLDAAISEDSRGTVEWEIGVLGKHSPARVGYVGTSRYTRENYFPQIGRECVRGMRLLSERAERAPKYSDAALYKTQTLAKLTRQQLALLQVQVNDDEVPITAKLSDNIDILTKESEEEDGSIVGSLDSISVHRGNEFRVWDENTDKAVRCFFPTPLLEKAKENLKHRVLVIGKNRINRLGNIVSVSVEDIENYGSKESLPTIEQMSGSLKNLTGDLSLREYMKAIRED